MNTLYQIPITRFAITFTADTDIQLPQYAGSALRGIFGRALQDIACATASHHQGHCRCQSDCLYRMLFDPKQRYVASQERMQDIPPPFVIEAYSLPVHIKQGQSTTFYMILFGKMAHSEQLIIKLAWKQALNSGFDQPNHKKATAKLLAFAVSDQPLPNITPKNSLVLDLCTHLRVQHHGKIMNAHGFCAKIFCQALIRRYQVVAEIYGDGYDMAEIGQLYQDASQVDGSHHLKRHAWSRYSKRQNQKISQDGLLGQIELSGVTDRLYQLLYLGQWLHVGKGSVFGLGQYQIR